MGCSVSDTGSIVVDLLRETNMTECCYTGS